MPLLVGGIGATKPTDETCRAVLEAVTDALIQDLNKSRKGRGATEVKTAGFECVSYKTQIVAGTNYFIKVKILDNGEFVHVRIYRDLTGATALHGIKEPVLEADEIEYF